MPPAVHGGPPKSALSAKDGAMTVKEILAHKNGSQRRESVWDGIVLPSARSTWLMPSLSWVTPEYVERVLTGALSGESPEEEHALYELMMQSWPRL